MFVPDDEARHDIFAAIGWLLADRTSYDHLILHAPLVTPTSEDFPVLEDLAGHELATDYFAFVSEHARMGDGWRFALVEERPIPIDGAPLDVDAAEAIPSDARPVAYPVEALDDPQLLVAILAHAMSRHVVWERGYPPPGGWGALEPVAEVGAVLMGFGIFLANTAGTVLSTRQGPLAHGPVQSFWLSQRDLAYALAVFGWLKEIPDATILSHLEPGPRAFYRAAVRDLRRRARELRELRVMAHLPHAGPYR